MFFRRRSKAPAEVERLDWKLLERGAVALYHKPAVLSQDLAWLRGQRYAIHELDAGGWASPADFHADAQRALGFPSSYAKNLASWIDCLAELAVPEDGGMAIVFRRYDSFARSEPSLAQTILDSLETTSRRFLLTGGRLLGLVQSDDPRIRFERVGARPVTWNPREWQESDRGIGPAGSAV